jgi:hypothetical protein
MDESPDPKVPQAREVLEYFSTQFQQVTVPARIMRVNLGGAEWFAAVNCRAGVYLRASGSA